MDVLQGVCTEGLPAANIGSSVPQLQLNHAPLCRECRPMVASCSLCGSKFGHTLASLASLVARHCTY